jgi:dihydroorotate dehydrogenase electron transfer subunit
LARVSSSPGFCRVLLGGRSSDEILFLTAEFTRLGYLVETATDDGTLGHRGLVTDLLPPSLPLMKQVYVCGPHPMMAAVAGMCREAGVACQASLEAHMACGLGACLGCTVHGTETLYRHVCKHGPVFNAEEVAWTR